MFHFFQDIFDKIVSLLTATIITVGLVSAPSLSPVSHQSLPEIEKQPTVVIQKALLEEEKIIIQETVSEKEKGELKKQQKENLNPESTKVEFWPSTISSPDSILCNGEYYDPCPARHRFYCPSTGDPQCISDDTLQCNDEYYDPCPTGHRFYCPPVGDAECIAENSQSIVGIRTVKKPIEQEVQSQVQITETMYYPVIKVVDGDTFSVDINGYIQMVRLIGLDTPETVHPSKPVECFGQEASHKAKQILTNQKVRLELDPTQGEYGRYGRLLVYAFLEDGRSFNKLMIEEGYGFEYTYNIPYKYQSEFQMAEHQARISKRGLWADDACDTPESSTTQSQETTPPETSSPPLTKNECSYDAYDCSGFSTHAEAQATYEYCGGVDNDIHELDKDGDGLACEGLP